MALTDLKAREIFFVVIGWTIALLLIVTFTRFSVRGFVRAYLICL
jgi:hypothetical protein